MRREGAKAMFTFPGSVHYSLGRSPVSVGGPGSRRSGDSLSPSSSDAQPNVTNCGMAVALSFLNASGNIDSIDTSCFEYMLPVDFECSSQPTAFFAQGKCPRAASLLLGVQNGNVFEGSFVGQYYAIYYAVVGLIITIICLAWCCCWCFSGLRELFCPSCAGTLLTCRFCCCCKPKDTAYNRLGGPGSTGPALLSDSGRGVAGVEMHPVETSTQAGITALQPHQQQALPATMLVTVPSGVQPGQVFTAVSPMGRQLAVQCPAGVQPGQQVSVANPDTAGGAVV